MGVAADCGVLRGQSIQYAAALVGEYGFFKKGLEMLVCEQQLLFLVFKLLDLLLNACDFFLFGFSHDSVSPFDFGEIPFQMVLYVV